uniref:RRM domain-containing protein n=1 Tax=Araucaria cunninghamii TaxID=56994 RepID=A0A0D6QYL9_ARACU
MALRRLAGATTIGRLLMGREPCVAAQHLPANGFGVRLESTQDVPEPSTKLFVSGLSKRTTDEGLRAAFEKFGRVLEARVVTDRMSGVSKGFAFVRFASQEEADKGKEGMDGKFLDGWVIFADYARPRPPRNFANSQGPNPGYGGAPRNYDNFQGPNPSYGGTPSYYDNSQGPNPTYGGTSRYYDNSQVPNPTYGSTSYDNSQGQNPTYGGASPSYDNSQGSNASYSGTHYDNSEGPNTSYGGAAAFGETQKY